MGEETLMQIVHDESLVIAPPIDTTQIKYTSYEVATGGTPSSTVTVDDVVYSRVTPATKTRHAQIDVLASSVTSPIFQSLDPTKSTVDQSGKVTTLASGAVRILVTVPPFIYSVSHAGEVQTGQTVDTFLNYVTGSLGRAITDAIVDRAVEGKSKYANDPNCWIDLDFSCWPSQKFGGCLISPQHLLTATHAWPGTSIKFIAPDGTVVNRTLSTVDRVSIVGIDMRIALLNEPVPESIAYCRIMPPDWRDYLTVKDLPILAGDQERKVLARKAIQAQGGGYIVHQNATRSELLPFTESIVSGDSGSPLWVIIDDELVLLGTHWGESGFFCVSDFIDEINEAMDTLGGGYQLDEIDLSAYPTY